jgi:hypothetical protein
MSSNDIMRMPSVERWGGAFKHETVTTRRGRTYMRLTTGSGGAQCQDPIWASFRGRCAGWMWPCQYTCRPATWWQCGDGLFKHMVIPGLAPREDCQAPVHACVSGVQP